MTKEGQPYGPARFKSIIKENYFICKNCNTSYDKVLEMTPSEKIELIKLVQEESDKMQQLLESQKEKISQNNSNNNYR